MAPFYGWGSTPSRLQPLREGSLLFTTKFPEIHLQNDKLGSVRCFIKFIEIYKENISRLYLYSLI